ncbi:MAG TPA: hypothetical protein VF054_08075 [Micromonosporaceae bacterium]
MRASRLSRWMTALAVVAVLGIGLMVVGVQTASPDDFSWGMHSTGHVSATR